MLGIGFIITHLVAMQKPQQRKYHSSCNRSVHRGTAHGKQEVKVCKRKTPHLFWCGVFCPLTGMVQIWNEWFRDQNLFSPPYGDGTFYKLEKVYTKEFSPPYGDGIAYTHLDSGLLTFSPPYGDSTTGGTDAGKPCRFSPPYGDDTKSLDKRL